MTGGRLRLLRGRSRLTSWWVNLPIGWKGLLVVALPVFAFVTAISLRAPFIQRQQQLAALLARSADTRDMAQDLVVALLDVDAGVRGYALTRSRALLPRAENARQTVPHQLTGLGGVLTPGDEMRIYESVAHDSRRALELSDKIIRAIERGAGPDDGDVQTLLAQEREAMDAVRQGLGVLRRNQDGLLAESEGQLEALSDRVAPLMLATIFVGVFGALGAAYLFATGIASRLRALELNAERLAHGERLKYAPSRGHDEIGSLDRALRRASLLLRFRDRELRNLNAALERTVNEQALLNRELEAFSYSVSHDLRAPLRSIDGFAQALREDWGDRLDPAGQDHLARVRNAAQKMGRLIDDLLKLSRLTRAQVQRADVDLTRVAQDIAAELTERNPTRVVRWSIEEGLHASCDQSLARIMLENLLGNAWKFTSKTAEATVSFSKVPGTQPPVFVVQDNGAGFDMRYVDKLFAPFQRLHGEREFPGTGIGLATVQRIVRKHGGDVRPEGHPGRGASFSFTLEPGDGVAAA